ncbi:hypothetical protein L6164_032860 [Bauhinia variegata]|uniref:Uncharacterized protein n=1 Tax=Bauhinia variegata TaxID=167791 RepID=A0ACB9KPW7_BAUVA|nr:hypothetical protein L6164_032860 [Bauhinia variegata]
MDFKPWVVFLLLALATVAGASKVHEFGVGGSPTTVGDLIGEDNEMMVDSESARRTLQTKGRYISYAALKKNSVPCGQNGVSYYGCRFKVRQANPYNRGCTIITGCARYTD